MSNETPAEVLAAKNLIPQLQSVRDRLMSFLGPRFGESFDGDMDVLLDTINYMKHLSRSLATGKVAGWAIVDNRGCEARCRLSLQDFFGAVTEGDPLTAEDVAKLDAEYPGLAPHRLVTLYTAPPADPAKASEPDDCAEHDAAMWELIRIAEECGAVKDSDDNSTWWTLDPNAFYALETRIRDAVSVMRQAEASPAAKASGSAPDGWVFVPAEADENMLYAGQCQLDIGTGLAGVWERMIANRPKILATPPASAPEVTGVPEDDDGQPVGYADWYNTRYFGQSVDTSRDHACESAWRAGYTAALQQEGNSHG